MGMSVSSQCDTKQYFSISRIDPKMMEEHGLNMTIKELRNLARSRVPFNTIPTGQSDGHIKMTKIYRYQDFK